MASPLEDKVEILAATNREFILRNEAVLAYYWHERPTYEWHAFALGFVVAALLAIVLLISFDTDKSTPVVLLAFAAFMVLVLPWLAARSRTIYKVLRKSSEDQLAAASQS